MPENSKMIRGESDTEVFTLGSTAAEGRTCDLTFKALERKKKEKIETTGKNGQKFYIKISSGQKISKVRPRTDKNFQKWNLQSVRFPRHLF